jgi:hypothetical protein
MVTVLTEAPGTAGDTGLPRRPLAGHRVSGG